MVHFWINFIQLARSLARSLARAYVSMIATHRVVAALLAGTQPKSEQRIELHCSVAHGLLNAHRQKEGLLHRKMNTHIRDLCAFSGLLFAVCIRRLMIVISDNIISA